MHIFERLCFGVFGLAGRHELKSEKIVQPVWTGFLFKFFFGIYLLVSVVVLIKLLIAMMTDTYQQIQVTRVFALGTDYRIPCPLHRCVC